MKLPWKSIIRRERPFLGVNAFYVKTPWKNMKKHVYQLCQLSILFPLKNFAGFNFLCWLKRMVFRRVFHPPDLRHHQPSRPWWIRLGSQGIHPSCNTAGCVQEDHEQCGEKILYHYNTSHGRQPTIIKEPSVFKEDHVKKTIFKQQILNNPSSRENHQCQENI